MKLKINKSIFNDAYLADLYGYSYRIQVFYGGAGSGKSVAVAYKLVIKALGDKRKILILRKVNRSTKNSTFQLILDVLERFKITNKCSINKTDYTIILPNGSTFIFGGLDNSEKIKSITGITDAWLEEATEFSLNDFSQVNLRIRDPYATNQQLYLSFNPVSKASWCYLQFFADNPELEEFRKKVKIIHTNYQDNRFLPDSYISSLLDYKKTNPVYYGIYALGNFGSLDKLVYNNWQIMDFDERNIKGQLMCGLDFGYTNDPTAFIASIFVEEENRIYIFKEWGGTGYLNDQIANKIRELGFSKSTIIADCAEEKSIEEIKRDGIGHIKPSVKGKGSVLQGIQKLQQYELIVHPNCKNTIEELENYSWLKDKDTNEYINEPIDKWNHWLDALRYSLQCCDIRYKLKSMNKDLLF